MAETTDEKIERLLLEVRLVGFAAAKEIARLRGLASGTMPCPLCQQPMKFSTAAGNNHFRAKCETPDCIHAME